MFSFDLIIYIQILLSNFYTTAILLAVQSITVVLRPFTSYAFQILISLGNHEASEALRDMIKIDGAGSWPPKASHRDTWPTVLRPYHDIFLELAPLLPVDRIITNDSVNQVRRVEYRTRMQKLLQERLDLSAIKSLLFAVEKTNNLSLLPANVCNGLFACIAHLRHAFRWGTVPIVKVAQEEKFIDFPVELDISWEFLRRRYGITSQGGSVMSNMYCNLDGHGGLVYQVNRGMPKPVQSGEYNLAYAFSGPEMEALPIYYHVVQSIITFEKGYKKQCSEHLKTINVYLARAVRVYYDSVIDSKIPRSVFVAYLQGFHGWAAGEIIDGEYIEYDGVSGAQGVLFNLLDMFLGLEAFIDEESFVKYFPISQRRFMASVKKHSFRDKAKQNGDIELERRFDSIVRQIRVFRSAHRKRTSRYLNVGRPERVLMTAGASTLESGSEGKTEDLVNFVDAGLTKQMKKTT